MAVLLFNRKEFIELFFAAAKLGLVFVPLNTKLSVPELTLILEHAQPALVLCEKDTEVTAIFTPLYRVGGLSVFMTPIMGTGGRLVLHRGFDAEEVLEVMVQERVTVALGVPTIWQLLADHPLFNEIDLSHVRWLISGGAPLPVSLISRYREKGLVMRQGYGLTEVGVNCFAMSDEEAWRKAGSIGKSFPFTRARIVGEDNRQLPPGQGGELRLAGPHVCLGNLRNPQATDQAFDEEGLFRTGDLAYEDEEGSYFIAGRKKRCSLPVA